MLVGIAPSIRQDRRGFHPRFSRQPDFRTLAMASAPPTCQTGGMSFAELRHELEIAPRLPEAALRMAGGHVDELVPVVRGLIEKLKAGTFLLPDQDRLLFYGLHVLAAA